MEAIGILKTKFDTQKVSDKFNKRDFVLTTEHTTPYPQQVSFQLTQDKCGILDQFNEGDSIRVQFNLRGREWNGPQGLKYFNTLEAWRIEKAGSETNNQSSSKTSNAAPAGKTNVKAAETNVKPADVIFTPSNDDDDLPF